MFLHQALYQRMHNSIRLNEFDIALAGYVQVDDKRGEMGRGPGRRRGRAGCFRLIIDVHLVHGSEADLKQIQENGQAASICSAMYTNLQADFVQRMKERMK